MINLTPEAEQGEWQWLIMGTKCATLLVILYGGEPDLIDAIIQWMGRYP